MKVINKIEDIPLNIKVEMSGTIGYRTTFGATGIFREEKGEIVFYNDDGFSYKLSDEMKENKTLTLGITRRG